MASLEELRKTRTVKKTLVTKKVIKFRTLVIDDAYSKIIEKFDLINGVFYDFMKSHNEYHDEFTEDSDILVCKVYVNT